MEPLRGGSASIFHRSGKCQCAAAAEECRRGRRKRKGAARSRRVEEDCEEIPNDLDGQAGRHDERDHFGLRVELGEGDLSGRLAG